MANPPEAESSDDETNIAAEQLVQKGNTLGNRWIIAIAILFGQAGALILFERLVSPEETESNWGSAWLWALVVFVPPCKIAGLILGIQNCTWLKSLVLPLPFLILDIMTDILPILFWWNSYLANFIIFLLWSHIVLRLTTLGTIVYVLLAIAVWLLATIPLYIKDVYGVF